MRCRKNVRKLIVEYNAAGGQDDHRAVQVPSGRRRPQGGAQPAGAAAHPGEPVRRLRLRAPAVDGRTRPTRSRTAPGPPRPDVLPVAPRVPAPLRTGPADGLRATRRSACPTGTGASTRHRPTPDTRSSASSSAATVSAPGIVVADGVLRQRQRLGPGHRRRLRQRPAARREPRQAAARASAPGLARPASRAAVIASLAVDEYDVSPWNVNSAAARTASATGSRAGSVRRPASNMHNRVHVWVGGSMLPGTSPNDPVFFLNHAKEDELWAVWMQKYPTVPHYLPLDSEPLPGRAHPPQAAERPHGGARRVLRRRHPGPADRPARPQGHHLVRHRSAGHRRGVRPGDRRSRTSRQASPRRSTSGSGCARCRTDVLQRHRRTDRQLQRRSAGPTSWSFPNEANDFEILEIGVQFHAVGANVQVAAIDLQATVIDEEGYYAANQNDPFVVGTFHIELVASNIVTADSSIALVLDRSGSMADVANGGATKATLLKRAVGVRAQRDAGRRRDRHRTLLHRRGRRSCRWSRRPPAWAPC